MKNPDPIDQHPVAEHPVLMHPVAWLRPMPEGYRIPLWRWILLPATAWMLKRNQGVWVSGEVQLRPDRILFAQSRMMKSRAPAAQWELLLSGISNVTVQKGIASETLSLHHSNGTVKLMSVRSEDFVAQLREAIAAQ